MWMSEKNNLVDWGLHVCLLSFILTTSAFGQAVPVDTLIRQHERAVQDATRRESRDVDSLSPDTDTSNASPRPQSKAGECRVIQTIRLEGHLDVLGTQPQEVFSTYLGQCLMAEEINALLGDLNRWYQRRGWTTTRVYAAEQDINGGELILRVVAGRIEGYRYIDKEADERLAYAFPQERDGYLNLRDLEQGLENLNRVPSQEAKFQLYPGKEPGTSVVVVEMTEKSRTRWTEMLDNSGNASMGHWRSNTEFAIDNLLGRNDQLAIGYNRNLDRGTLGSTFEGFTANYSFSSGIAHKVAHALVGCASAAAKDTSCAAGAIGGAVGEAFAEMYGQSKYGTAEGSTLTSAQQQEVLTLSKLVAAATAGVTGKDAQSAVDAAQNAVINNALIQYKLKGMASAYVDDEFAPKLEKWIQQAKAQGVDLVFNEAFRTTEYQAGLANNPNAITPAKAGGSLHEAGFAVDVNFSSLRDIPGGLTGGEQRAIILKSAQDAGLSWGGNFNKTDYPHFYVDPGGRTAKIIDAQKTYCQISGGCK